MRRLRPAPQAGFTLMEIVIAAAPLLLFSLTLFAAFQFTLGFSRRGDEGVEAVQQARLALHLMANELREAGAAPGEIVTWSRADGDAIDGIAFLTARANGPGRAFATDVWGVATWRHAVYYVLDEQRGELRRVVTDPAPLPPPRADAEGRTVARRVKTLRLARDAGLITITLVVRKPSGEAVLETAVRPRN